jgi:sirohydrochlorin ferrochelatase
MEQDQLLGRDQPLIEGRASTALLLAAHGERTPDAGNESVTRVAAAIDALQIVSGVAVGFINGTPTIAKALSELAARTIIVYPLFASNGYFTRDRLVQLIDEANADRRQIRILPPLGLDPGLANLVADRISQMAAETGCGPTSLTAVLLAHGSRRNPASREATESMAREIAGRAVFKAVDVAFLEERPFLDEAMSSTEGPAVVVGMFSGDGLHGARDAPRLVARLGRPDVRYAGVIGNLPGIAEVVRRSVLEALAGNGRRLG